MNNQEIAKKIEELFKNIKAIPKYENQVEVILKGNDIVGLLTVIKSLGFEHLSNITCVDWIKDNRFDVTYNIWSYTHKVHITVKAGIDRSNPEIPTVMNLWPQAQVYERETHEMFGVRFIGNPDLSPLFLHNWKDIPPLRKDFDTVEYSKRAYGASSDEGGNE